jgi:host factor-I protein
MPQEPAGGLQDSFLHHVQNHNVPLTVFLVNGIKLQGYVTHIDKFGIALTRDQQTQFIYKHAISAINPLTAIDLPSDAE